MSLTGRADADPHSSVGDQYGGGSLTGAPVDHPQLVLDVEAAADGVLMIPGGAFLLHADYDRQGPDLLLRDGDGGLVRIVDFFAVDPAPHLEGDTGLRVSAETAAKLAGPAAPGQYAQVGPAVAGEPVAKVETITGEVVAQRADGTRVVLADGAPVFQGDVLETGAGAAVGLVYVDGMTMSLDENTRMVIDQVFYNPAAGQGRALFSLVRGAFMSLSGKIAKLGPDVMEIETPTGTSTLR